MIKISEKRSSKAEVIKQWKRTIEQQAEQLKKKIKKLENSMEQQAIQFKKTIKEQEKRTEQQQNNSRKRARTGKNAFRHWNVRWNISTKNLKVL